MSAQPVLLIDDDAPWCDHVCRFLEQHGIEVVTATSEAAALQTLATLKPVAILIEPLAVDPAFTKLVRDLPELEGVPLFFMSSAPARSVFRKYVGVTGYVHKDVAVEHLMFLLGDATAAAGRHASLVVAA